MGLKGKLAAAGASVLLICAVIGTVVFVKNRSANSVSDMSTSLKAIKAFCAPTDYKDTCESSLAKAAANSTDTMALILASFRANVNHLENATARSSVLANAEKDPEAASYLNDCGVYLGYAMEDLEDCIARFQGYELHDAYKVAYDVQNFLSAISRYQEECLEAFKDAESKPAKEMKEALKEATEMTSNALAVISKLVEAAESVDMSAWFGDGARKMMEVDSEGFPSWVSSEQRRLVEAKNPWEMKPLVTVAKDGNGNFTTINEALKAMPVKSTSYVVMYVKEGVYDERVTLEKNMTHIVMVGDGPTKTKITGKLSVAFVKNMTTFKSATFAVRGEKFIAKDIGFENTAGAEGHQAVALRVGSHKSVFYNCQIDGFQDTLYVHSLTQFYRDCTISGTVDFIFGDSTAYFQNCNILIRKPGPNQSNIVTAQGRKDRNEVTAIVLDNCTISADPALLPFVKSFKSYLARPWKAYSRTIIKNSQIDEVIHADGYTTMFPGAEETCFYVEAGNRGIGASKAGRLSWNGVKKDLELKDLGEFTVKKFLHPDEEQWLEKTKVPVY